MKAHRYKVCLSALDGQTGPALDFVVSNHDDIFAIVDRLRRLAGIDSDDAAALGVGLKLFTGVSLKYRGTAPFDALQPAMRVFIQSLKTLTAKPAIQTKASSTS